MLCGVCRRQNPAFPVSAGRITEDLYGALVAWSSVLFVPEADNASPRRNPDLSFTEESYGDGVDTAGRHETQKGEIPRPSLVRLGALIKIIWIGDTINWEAENKGLQDSLVHEICIAAQRTGGVTIGC